MVLQNDPLELLEVLDRTGRPTGVGKSRSAIHLDGDWHRAFHCWIVRQGPRGLEVVLQLRSSLKDTFPECWDASSAGHWRLNESPAEAARELVEELGIQVAFERLVPIGRERLARKHGNGLVDREFHEVYRLTWSAPLSSFRPDPREVSGVSALPLRELVELLQGLRPFVDATDAFLLDGNGQFRPGSIRVERASVVPYSAARLLRLKRGLKTDGVL